MPSVQDSPPAGLETEVLEVLLELDDHGAALAAPAIVARIPADDDEVDAAITRVLEAGTAVLGDDGHSIGLSAPGRQRAVAAVRRHRLTERFLADVVGLEWSKVHHEAARWDGVVSDDVEARFVELLDDPGTCPHGNPIPGSAHLPVQDDAVRLADAAVGPVHVVRVTETLEGDDEALQLLQAAGVLPDRDLEVQARVDGWVQVAGSVRDVAIPPHVAEHTYVCPR